MTDYAMSWTAQRLATNDSDKFDDATGKAKFTPPLNAVHLAGEKNYNQYSEKLYGHADGDFNHSRTEEEAEADRAQKNGHFITEEAKLLAEKLAALIADAKAIAPKVPQDKRRERSLISMNAADYKDVDYMNWFPGRLAKECDPSIKLRCWMGDKCVRKDAVAGPTREPQIKEQRVRTRRAVVAVLLVLVVLVVASGLLMAVVVPVVVAVVSTERLQNN
jgi:hypothetical protein